MNMRSINLKLNMSIYYYYYYDIICAYRDTVYLMHSDHQFAFSIYTDCAMHKHYRY